jgi:hypothetical protein
VTCSRFTRFAVNIRARRKLTERRRDEEVTICSG